MKGDEMKKSQKVVESNENVVEETLKTLTTTSAKIRYLTSQNYTRSKIAKMLNIRYQHVRNVQLQPLKKSV